MTDYYILTGLLVLALAGGLYLKRQARLYREANPRRCCSCCDCPCHARDRAALQAGYRAKAAAEARED